MKRLYWRAKRAIVRWKDRFRKGPVYGLSGWDLLRIGEHRDLRPLDRIPHAHWCDAIREVPVPKSGYDMHLDLNALLVLARRAADGVTA
jgi:hypothetical protein